MPLIQKINVTQIKEFASSFKGKFLFTKSRKKQFRVNVLEEGLEFIPQSSGIARKESYKNLEKVIKHFSVCHSFEPKEYHDLTYNSVYILKIIEEYFLATTK
jgi:hypothetical protein